MADTRSHRNDFDTFNKNHYYDDTYVTVMDGGYTKGMSKGKKMSLRSMIVDHLYQKGKSKFKCPAAFMHDLGYHEVIAHADNFIAHYNGCAIIDIDPPKNENGEKTWSEEHTINILKTLNDELRSCPHYIMIEPSYSGKGLHLLFGRRQSSYTTDDYFLFCGYCMNIVADKLIKIGFDENEVVGTNTMIQSSGQLIDGSTFDLIRKYFYSYKSIFCNENWNPIVDWKYEPKYSPIDNKLHHKLNDKLNDVKITSKFSIPKVNDVKIIQSCDRNINSEDYSDCFSDAHENRLKLCATVLRICINNFDRCDNYVRKTALSYVLKFAEIMWKDKVSDDRYNYCINDCTNKVLRTLNDNCYANYNILNFLKDIFGFVEINPNEFILSDNEFLYDIIDKIPFKTGFNLLISGTGTGKTECWKRLTEWDPMNPAGNKVVVCEPYISIIESKYNNTVHKAYGSVVIDSSFKADLTVTNYNKIIKLDDEYFNNIDYLVIDESHLIFSEVYRWDITEKFVKKLMSIKDRCKIIFQTATPAYEKQLFNICKDNVFVIKKQNKKVITIDYKNSLGGKYKLWNAYKLANKYLNENICDRVFIYNGNGGFNDSYVLPESKYKTGIYHKKNPDKECIDYIDTYHKMGDYKILITSCWFGVGHDLHDDDRCCVIVCGNNTYHEEIQCIGRFRDAKEIMCVILPDNYNRHDNIYKSQAELRNLRNKISENNSFNSFVISDGISGHIYDDVDCYLAWYMWMYKYMYNNISTKLDKYDEFGFKSFVPIYYSIENYKIEEMKNCKCKLKDALGIKYEDNDILVKTGEYKRDSRYHRKGECKFTKSGNIRVNSYGTYDIYKNYNFDKKFDGHKQTERAFNKLNKKIEILKKLYDGSFMESDFEEINDNWLELSEWTKTVHGMSKYERNLFEFMYNNNIGKNIIINDLSWYKYALRYIRIANSDDYDAIENIIVDYMLDNDTGYSVIDLTDGKCLRKPLKDKVLGFDILYLYCIYYLYGFYDNKKIRTNRADGFFKLYQMTHIIGFDDYVKNWFRSKLNIKRKSNFIDYVISNGNIELKDDYDIIKSHGYSINEIKNVYYDIMKFFFDKEIDTCDDKRTLSDITKCIEDYNSKNGTKIGGKIGGKIGKAVTITDNIKKSILTKYRLNIGDTFETQKDLANKISKSEHTISEWRNKGWIR